MKLKFTKMHGCGNDYIYINCLEKEIEYDLKKLAIKLSDRHFGVGGERRKKYYVHTLNNTLVAPPRMLIAFLENNYNKDKTVSIPKPLQKYMGGKEILK